MEGVLAQPPQPDGFPLAIRLPYIGGLSALFRQKTGFIYRFPLYDRANDSVSLPAEQLFRR